MSNRNSFLVLILVALALTAILVPAAQASGGATSRTYAPPPLDAGSAVPNPDYTVTSIRPDSRDGFDWGDAGIGAGTIAFVLIGIAPVLLVRSRGRRLARS